MTRRFAWLAWSAAACTYFLVILGAIVRITGSGMGCGDDWPLCHGRIFPPLNNLGTLIEWNHRLAAALTSVLVVVVAGYAHWLRKGAGSGERDLPGRAAYVAAGLLVLQVALGAVTVKLELPPWTVILHLGTAMLLLAALIFAALGARATPRTSRPGAAPGWRPGLVAAALSLVTVLFGALTANLGAASACLGFPLCNGQLVPEGNYLQQLHWTHRLLAYALAAYTAWWAYRTKTRGPLIVLGLVALQVAVAAAMVLLGLPQGLQAAHVAVGAAVWTAVVIVAVGAPPAVRSAVALPAASAVSPGDPPRPGIH